MYHAAEVCWLDLQEADYFSPAHSHQCPINKPQKSQQDMVLRSGCLHYCCLVQDVEEQQQLQQQKKPLEDVQERALADERLQ